MPGESRRPRRGRAQEPGGLRVVMVSPDAPPDPYGGIGTYLEGLLGAMAS
ncbi:MAG: hypothetical protein IRZ05_21190, partial [Micromonosporaceae bacterium]|nr:hypothetical protein [Micromonosporaceae bacterium]